MLHSHFHYHLLFPITTPHHYPSFSSSPSSSPPLVHFLHHRPKNKNIHSPHTTVVSAIPSWITQLTTTVTEDPSAIQVSSSVLLTTAITVFVFPSLQRRIKKAKQLVYILCFFSLLSFMQFKATSLLFVIAVNEQIRELLDENPTPIFQTLHELNSKVSI